MTQSDFDAPERLAFLTQPQYVGRYTIGGNVSFAMTRRPHWMARQVARWLLDWRWSDLPTPPE